MVLDRWSEAEAAASRERLHPAGAHRVYIEGDAHRAADGGRFTEIAEALNHSGTGHEKSGHRSVRDKIEHETQVGHDNRAGTNDITLDEAATVAFADKTFGRQPPFASP